MLNFIMAKFFGQCFFQTIAGKLMGCGFKQSIRDLPRPLWEGIEGRGGKRRNERLSGFRLKRFG
jgi:hypothetical protein